MSTIKLYSKSNRIVVKQTQTNIKLSHLENHMRFKEAGRRGLKGDTGETGIGMPTGGLLGQVVVKLSNNDYDFGFQTLTDLSDKNYEQSFNTSSFVLVTHNLNKYPSILIRDSAGDEVEGSVNHVNRNSLTITFSAPFSGTVSCN